MKMQLQSGWAPLPATVGWNRPSLRSLAAAWAAGHSSAGQPGPGCSLEESLLSGPPSPKRAEEQPRFRMQAGGRCSPAGAPEGLRWAPAAPTSCRELPKPWVLPLGSDPLFPNRYQFPLRSLFSLPDCMSVSPDTGTLRRHGCAVGCLGHGEDPGPRPTAPRGGQSRACRPEHDGAGFQFGHTGPKAHRAVRGKAHGGSRPSHCAADQLSVKARSLPWSAPPSSSKFRVRWSKVLPLLAKTLSFVALFEN